ncbi:MAG TPA: hypothetical protein VIK01_09650 [Polyangiaceae bacterium]
MRRGIWGAAISSLVLAAAPAQASPKPGSFWISLSAEYRTGALLREWGGFLAVGIPLDRFAQPRALAVLAVPVVGSGLAENPPKKEAVPSPATESPPPSKTTKNAPGDLASGKSEPLLLLTPRLARGTVRRALASAGYLDARTRLTSLSARSRSSAALPELRLRALRTTGQTLRLTPTTDDPYRYSTAGAAELAFEARLTWHLDRLVFSNEEVGIERLQSEWNASEHKLIEHVLLQLALWQRSRVRAADVDSEPEVRETAELLAIGAAVELDVLTDGWFSQAIDERAGQSESEAGEPAKAEVDTPRHAR